jgi:hypothetical protein
MSIGGASHLFWVGNLRVSCKNSNPNVAKNDFAESPMNRVPLNRRVQIINCLVEGNSIRSTERMTGTHRDTICRLLVEVGDGCAKLMDEQMRELSCRRIGVDEIWAYVGKKQRHMTPLDDPRRVGDQYTFVVLDPDTKIVSAYRVGKRDLPNTATVAVV